MFFPVLDGGKRRKNRKKKTRKKIIKKSYNFFRCFNPYNRQYFFLYIFFILLYNYLKDGKNYYQ